jgi:hypothetical protein
MTKKERTGLKNILLRRPSSTSDSGLLRNTMESSTSDFRQRFFKARPLVPEAENAGVRRGFQ